MTRTAAPGLAALAVAGLGTSFALGVAVATDDGGRPDPRVAAGPPHGLPVSYANDDLAAAESCDDLLDWYVERGVERVTAFGWDYPYIFAEADNTGGDLGAPAAGAPEAAAQSGAEPTTDRATASATGTNVQEAGVDEPDVVKTDGRLLVRVLDGDLVTYDLTGDEPERLASLDLADAASSELLLVEDRVVVVSTDLDEDDRESTTLQVVDLTDPAAPEIVHTAVYDTALVTARQHDDTVRIVVEARLPALDFVQPRAWRSEDSARDHNQDVVRDSEIEDWLPTVTVDGTTEPLLSCGQVALPADDAGLGTLTVIGLDPDDPETWSVQGVATASQIAYFSPDRMYLAAAPWSGAPWSGGWGCCWEGGDVRTLPEPEAQDGTTHLYAFALAGTRASYVASGAVDGAVADRWSMDAVDGVLRVAVGPTIRTGSFNSVVTLEEDGDDLVEIGRVDKLGVDETIRSVRWFDDLAIVVTFRQVDPLYAIDLTDPADPELLGALKVPGFSEYLHPLGSMRILGMGQDASTDGMLRGAQAALFDVTDLTDPTRLDVVTYQVGSVANAGTDPRQFTWLPSQRTALTVVSSGYDSRTGWVSVLTIEGGELANRMVEVEYGVEVDQVRLVSLPDDRVVLVTGDDVSFFEV